MLPAKDKRKSGTDMRIVDGAGREADFSALVREYVAALGKDLEFQGLSEELADPGAKYAWPNGRMLIALDEEGHPCGCVAYHRLTDRCSEMKRLYVRPSQRGTGVGKALATAIVERARADGFAEMVLDSAAPLVSALGLYHALGFEECAPYYENPMDDVIYLRKALR